MKVTDQVTALVMALLAVGCASCVHIEPRDYPNDWPPVSAAAGTCPDLTGNYANRDRGSPSEYLAKWILPKTTYPLEGIGRVLVTGPKNGTVTVRLMEDRGTEVVAREWKQDADYHCDDGWLVLRLESFFLLVEGYSVEARLARTADGQLVVERTATAAGVAPWIWVPVVTTTRNWHLYPAAESEAATPVPPTSVTDATDVTYSSAIWWFGRTRRVPGRLLIAKDGLVFFELRPSGVEAPYKISYPEIKWVSLDYSSKPEPLLSIHLQDTTAEYFSILKDLAGAIDPERTQAAYELVKERTAAPRPGRPLSP